MYSYKHFRENDALNEFMKICVKECGMIPNTTGVRHYGTLSLSGRGISIGVCISNDPICIEILFVNINENIRVECIYNNITFIINKMIDCAKKYNVVLGAWIDDMDIETYRNLGFRIVEVSERIWVEYSQLLN